MKLIHRYTATNPQTRITLAVECTAQRRTADWPLQEPWGVSCIDSVMSDEIVRWLPKGILPDPDPAEAIETSGDELALFVLHHDGNGSIWLSQEVRTREQVIHILEFVDLVRAKLLGLRDAS